MSAITSTPGDDPVNWGWEAAQASLGLNGATPQEQMLGAAILTIAAYLATALSLGATAVAIVFTTILFLIGFSRLVWQLLRE